MIQRLGSAISLYNLSKIGSKLPSRIATALMLALLASMAACTPTITSVCPPIQIYSKDFSMKLADEIEALPDSSLIPRVVSDYISMRDQLKTCRSK